jgi:hypothetical protein
LFGVSTALLSDHEPTAAAAAVRNEGYVAGENSASLGQHPRENHHGHHQPAVRRRSGKKSASYDDNRAQSMRASDLASTQDLLAAFFSPPFSTPDDASVVTYSGSTRDSGGGWFGREAFTGPEGAEHPLGYRSTGKYLNEAAFLQQLEQRHRADNLRLEVAKRSTSTPVSPARPPSSIPVPETTLSVRSSARTARLHRSASSVKSDASPGAASASPAFVGGALKLFPPSFFPPADKPCEACTALEAKLEAALDDIEYLRAAALQHEVNSALLPPSKSSATMNQPGPPSWPSSSASNGKKIDGSKRPSLIDASKQVAEATNRHRKQVEQLTKERVSFTSCLVRARWRVVVRPVALT